MRQRSASSKMRGRMRFVLAVFMALGFAVLVSQLFMIQLVQGEMYQERASGQQTRSIVVRANRGTIYDRNMTELARSGSVWNVCLSPAEIEKDRLDSLKAGLTENRLDDLATGLAEILELDKEFILQEAGDKTKYYKAIKRRVDHDTMQRVLEFITSEVEGVPDYKGVFFEPDTKRYYPFGNLASTVLGFTNFDNQGAYGIESYYNKVLSGTDGMVVSAKDAKGADMVYKYSQINDAKNGNSIVLTIDETIQHILERHLETAFIEHGLGNKCAGIVQDIKTGEILAMSTMTDFDPNHPEELKNPLSIAKLEEFVQTHSEDSEEYKEFRQNLQYDQWRNKAVSDIYEPGSVFKLITAATALDNNLVSLNEGFYCSGECKVANHTFHCHRLTGHGSQNFIEGIQNSCNPVFIAVGQRIGGALLHDYMQGFGFGEPTGVDLPGEENGIIQPLALLEKPGMVELSSNSFGQSFKVSPLQMITAASATVNGGKLMRPYVVKQVIDSEGNVLETTQPLVRRQVISEQTSETMRMLVESVVTDGSGSNAAVPGYRIGGKTGTSEKLDIRDRDVNVLSFCGFAPMEDPKYAVLVMLDEPTMARQLLFGSTIAAPVVGAIMQEMLPYVGLEPQYTAEELVQKDVVVPDLTGKKPHDAQAELLTERGLRMRYEGEGPSIIRQIPQAGATMPKGGTVIVFTDEESLDTEIMVPYVVGLPLIRANRDILDAGLNIELRGFLQEGVPSIVAEQWPLAGEQAQTGDLVVVTLRRAEAYVYNPESPSGAAGPAAESEASAPLEEPPEDEARYYGEAEFVAEDGYEVNEFGLVVPRE